MTRAGGARGTRAHVTFDDDPPQEMELLAGIATNGRLYGGLVPLVPDARVNDGLLDVVLFTGSGPVDAAAHVARVLAGLHVNAPGVTRRRVRRLKVVTASRPLPVQTDGDPRGITPLV